jgi:glycerol-3-phosphate dehydrogenase
VLPTPSPTPLSRLADAELDVLVIGAGITGACIALDAAKRGLRTALVDRGDFGAGATANCLRIVHGGLRYLQHLDFQRSRESIAERSAWLRSAPHLVEPLPVVIPSMRGTFPPRWMLAGALAVNEALSVDRNAGVESRRRIPRAEVLSRRECLSLVPALDVPGLTGGALFYDAIMYSPERLTLEVVQAAQIAGADTANYTSFERAQTEGSRIVGAVLRDVLTGDVAQVRTRWIVNAAGAQSGEIARHLAGDARPDAARYSLALNLVTHHPASGPAFTVMGGAGDPDRVLRSGARQLFVVPWRGQRLVGTAHFPFDGDAVDTTPPAEYVERFLDEIRRASPLLGVSRDDLRVVQWGLLPIAGPAAGDRVRLLKHHRIIDHRADGVAGAVSVVSVKFTTARRVAEEVVDRVAGPRRSIGNTPLALSLPGKLAVEVDVAVREAQERFSRNLPDDVIEHLVRAYGSRYGRVVALADRMAGGTRRLTPDAPVIVAQLVYGVREEQARTPEDLLWRRTELGSRGLLTEDAIREARLAIERPPID